ncbi:MAG: FAD-dependent oxidoreductase [Candidatus Levybacteria bacterium]|nr:FAD-dependent oxidoreductase [Candidatus Levybacteria bacterium]
MIIPRDFSLSFVKKEQVAHDAYSFYFSANSSEQNLNFLPGQYVKMFLDVQNPNDRGSSRTFSIASSPLEKDYVMITTRIIQSTFKKTLASLNPGVEVKFFGPTGRFVFDEKEPKPHIFLAGGIGITPFHSMLLYASEKKVQTPITLFVSFSKVEEMVFYDELTKIAMDHPNIKVVYTITHKDSPGRSPFGHLPGGLPASDRLWQAGRMDSWKVDPMEHVNTNETGRISEDMIKKYCPNFATSLFYISGPPAMVDGMVAVVNSLNISDEQIRKEKFIGY